MNLYCAVANAPTDYTDPLGLQIGAGYGTIPLPHWPDPAPNKPTFNPFSDAVSAFIEEFITTDPLQRKLFAHYRDKTGTPLTITKDDLKRMNPRPMSITQTREFQAAWRETGVYSVTDWQFRSVTEMPLTLNQVTVHLDGILLVCPPGRTYFKGKMTISDDYDFDLKGFFNSESGRSFAGELKAWLVHYFAGGTGYSVVFDPVDYEESTPPVSETGGEW